MGLDHQQEPNTLYRPGQSTPALVSDLMTSASAAHASLLTQGRDGNRIPHGNRVPFASCVPLRCLPRGGPLEESLCRGSTRPAVWGARTPDPGCDLSTWRGFGRRGSREPARSAFVLGGPHHDPDAGEKGTASASATRHEVCVSADAFASSRRHARHSRTSCRHSSGDPPRMPWRPSWTSRLRN